MALDDADLGPEVLLEDSAHEVEAETVKAGHTFLKLAGEFRTVPGKDSIAVIK